MLNGQYDDQKKYEIEWDIVARELKSPICGFHEVFLQALQTSFMELAAKNSMLLADQLQHLLGRHFLTLVGNIGYAKHILEEIQHIRMEAPVGKEQDVLLKQSSSISNQYISFLEFKTAMKMPTMIIQRLSKQDRYPLTSILKTTIPPHDIKQNMLSLPSTSDAICKNERPREYRANVCKRSRKWLGGPPRPRILIIKEDIVDLFKKGDKKKASKTIPIEHIDSISKSQLEFTIREKDGTSLILTCDSTEVLRHCVSEVATHCMYHVLDTGQPVQELAKFIRCGARLQGRPRISPTLQRLQILRFPTDALGIAYVVDERCQSSNRPEASRVSALLSAGASCKSLLRWAFAASFFLHKAPLSRNILDFFLQHRLPLDAAGDDPHSWNILQYLCLMRNVSSIERFFQHASKNELAESLHHVNGEGETALHVAIKQYATDKADAELIANLIVKQSLASEQFNSDVTWLNIRDQNGDTSLHAAMKAGMWTCAEKLLSARACTNTMDAQGNTAVHLALKLNASHTFINRVIRSASGRNRCHAQDEGLEQRDAKKDTALSLSIKLRNEAAVVRLLECGAQPDVQSCDWQDVHSTLSSEFPLHVAIKTGLPNAAHALVLHGAAWQVPDAQGAIPLSLALRYGMYALAYELITIMAGNENVEWVDHEVGDSVFGLAMKAGQLELASLLLDMSPATIHILHTRTLESPLHYVMKLREWLEYVEPNYTKQAQKKEKRNRFKSKSDGDVASLLVGDWMTMASTDELAHSFVRRALEGMLLGLIKQVDPEVCLSCPKRDSQSPEPIYHLVNSDDCITDHHSDSFTALHAAARGGRSMNHILRWIMLRLDEKLQLKALQVAVGPLQETALHVAISAGCIENALDLLDIAVKQNSIDRLSILNTLRTDEVSPLHLACRQPKLMLPFIERILVHDIYTEGWNSPDGMTALHVAIHHGADGNLIELLHHHHCDINARTEDGRTPLMVAIQSNNGLAFQKLIQLGANKLAVLPGSRLKLSELAFKMENLNPLIGNYFMTPNRESDVMEISLPIELEEEEVLIQETLTFPSISITRLSNKSIHDEINEEIIPIQSKPLNIIQKNENIWLNKLKEEEKATLQLVSIQAKQQAREWLGKKIGKQKVLSDSLLLSQQFYAEHGCEIDIHLATTQAEKLFIDRHVAEMVSEARLEIEREKQALLYQATRHPMSDSKQSISSFHSTAPTFLLETFISNEDESSFDSIDFEMRKTLC